MTSSDEPTSNNILHFTFLMKILENLQMVQKIYYFMTEKKD